MSGLAQMCADRFKADGEKHFASEFPEAEYQFADAGIMTFHIFEYMKGTNSDLLVVFRDMHGRIVSQEFAQPRCYWVIRFGDGMFWGASAYPVERHKAIQFRDKDEAINIVETTKTMFAPYNTEYAQNAEGMEVVKG